MGVNLGILVPKNSVDLRNLGNKRIAIDAYNSLYQFLAIIRGPDGTPLRDHKGGITSHLSGLFYRTCKLLEIGIKPIFVFDGVPPSLKEAEIKRRSNERNKALKKYENAMSEGRTEEARKYAQMTSRLKEHMIKDAKNLLERMGVPYVQAPSEGEAQAAHLVKKNDAQYCGSQDYDSILFGAPVLLRNLALSGKRKLPRKRVYIEVVPETILLGRVLKTLNITQTQLIDIGILIGTDFNPDGVKGVGPKTALKLIKKYGTVENTLSSMKVDEFPISPHHIRDIFLKPRVTNNYHLAWCEPDIEAVMKFLHGEKNFSKDRVQKALNKTVEGMKKAEMKTTLESWF